MAAVMQQHCAVIQPGQLSSSTTSSSSRHAGASAVHTAASSRRRRVRVNTAHRDLVSAGEQLLPAAGVALLLFTHCQRRFAAGM